MMEQQGDCLPLYVKLRDKLGDNGLISVLILRPRPPVLEIDSWLMSCRVLARGVEQYAMNWVLAFAKAHGYQSVAGTYIPTAKNGMVREFFAQFGFEKVEERAGGETGWSLNVLSYVPRSVCMREGEESLKI